MSTPIPVTTDTLPSNVPKLEIKGTNWAIFSLRLQIAVEAKELWKHFDGSTPRPVGATTTQTDGSILVSPPDPDALAKWQKNENLAKHLLYQRIPDSTALRVRNLTDVVAMWTEIVREYTEKGAYAHTDLRTKFLESKCPGNGDIRQFLDDLRAKRDELSAVGVQIEEKDYRSTIIQSLPSHLASFASGQLATARLYSPTQTIDPDILISLIIEESERRNRKDGRPGAGRGAAKGTDGDEALSVAPGGGRGNGRGGRRGGSSGRGRQRPPCWNCGSREHFKADCKEPDKSASKDSTAVVVKGAAHAATDFDSEDDGVFAVDVLYDPDSDLPDLLSLSSDSDAGERETFDVSDTDWFSEVGYDDGDLLWDGDDAVDCAAHVGDAQITAPVVELYDSGSTRHISPYRDLFETLTPIPPKAFSAANKQRFDATAVGDMVIEVPNGVEVSQLRLTEVLFSPEVGYTLVSIGRLDELGYSVTFADGVCTIYDPTSDVVGRVPKSTRGLYRVVHGLPGDVSASAETISVMELHRRMGHISPSVARRLAENGLVSGVKVDLSSGENVYCESCVYAKATRKPIAKEREGERAKEFADEVHTDLWGPAPVETFGGRRYYISFTDDKTRLTYLHLLRQKSEAFAAYKGFESWCQTQHGARIKVLHSDRGGEYLGKEFVMHLKAAGTEQKLTVHDTPEHNGVAERLNRTLMEKVCAMLHESGLPRTLWGEAVRHAVWLKNRTPTKALDGGTPLEAATGVKPDLSRVRVWGSRVLVRVEGGSKLGGRVVEGRWVGIDEASANGCRVYWPDRRTVTVGRSVYWDPSDAELLSREGEQDHLPGAILTPPAPSTQPPAPAPVTPPPTPLIMPAAPTKRARK